MKLEEARRQAHQRGVEMQPGDPTVELDGLYDQVDVGDLIHACLDETHPLASAPSRRYDVRGYVEWEAQREAIRSEIFDAFDAGTRGKPFKVRELAVAV